MVKIELRMINKTAIYVLWLREMKKFFRAKSRIIGILTMPLIFLAFFGLGFSNMKFPDISKDINYIQFLVPGIIGMTMLFVSVFAGFSVLWDKEYGFLKEIMVTPVSRVSIILGRIAGATTTALLQGIIILFISTFIGFKINGVIPFLLSIIFMILIATTFISMGLMFATKMKDMQGFSLIMNFIILPIFFLSGAMFPIKNLPLWLRYLSYIDPLTYGVDGLRGVMIGINSFSITFNFIILTGFSIVMVLLGGYFFEKSEVV